MSEVVREKEFRRREREADDLGGDDKPSSDKESDKDLEDVYKGDDQKNEEKQDKKSDGSSRLGKNRRLSEEESGASKEKTNSNSEIDDDDEPEDQSNELEFYNDKTDWWFLDVGSNIGYLSLCGYGRLPTISIEAAPWNFKLLNATREFWTSAVKDEEDGYEREWALENTAVSDISGLVVPMAGSGENFGGSSLVDSKYVMRDGDGDRETKRDTKAVVRTELLDDVLGRRGFWAGKPEAGKNSKCVAVMKLDVEGFEYKTLKGAKKLLSEKPPCFIAMEFHTRLLRLSGGNSSRTEFEADRDNTPWELLHLIRESGYEMKNGVGWPDWRAAKKDDEEVQEDIIRNLEFVYLGRGEIERRKKRREGFWRSGSSSELEDSAPSSEGSSSEDSSFRRSDSQKSSWGSWSLSSLFGGGGSPSDTADRRLRGGGRRQLKGEEEAACDCSRLWDEYAGYGGGYYGGGGYYARDEYGDRV